MPPLLSITGMTLLAELLQLSNSSFVKQLPGPINPNYLPSERNRAIHAPLS